MKKSLKHLGLTRIADNYVERLEQAQKLKDIANRANYSHKVKVLYTKIKEEHIFWHQKQNPPKEKLLDLDRDLIFVESQLNTVAIDKSRIDLLMNKYGCS